MVVAQRSKFACLRIEDDSDEERCSSSNKSKQQSGKGKGNNNAAKKAPGGGLIVHAVDRQRPKNKKNTAEKTVDPSTGLVISDAVAAKKETKKFEDADVTELSSTKSISISQLSEKASKKSDNIEISSPSSALYCARMNETVNKLNATIEELAKSNSQVEYHKDRYKKLVELFRDAELAEKAKITMDLESANETIQILTAQLSEVNGLLEQARSRLRTLEGHK